MFNIRTQAACAGPGSDLVRMSAFCAFDSTYSSRIIPYLPTRVFGGAEWQYALFLGATRASW